MLSTIKSQLTNRLAATDWYYLRKLRTGTDVPADIQDYSDTLYILNTILKNLRLVQ